MSPNYGFEFGVLVLPVLGSVDGVVLVEEPVEEPVEGLVALGSLGRPLVDEPVVGEVLGLAGLMAVDELPVALSVPIVPVPVVPVEPVTPPEVPVEPVEVPLVPMPEEPAVGAPVAAPPAAPPAPAPAPPAPPPDWAKAPKAAREPEARIVAANLPSRIFVCSSVRMKLRTGVGIV
ncbi:MAG TPA: hypothetical protein VH083_07920 [Myxococcales bacterium]|jgi:hypothetical protein|nr:hypothetical protein [Myxococcales bacterium]